MPVDGRRIQVTDDMHTGDSAGKKEAKDTGPASGPVKTNGDQKAGSGDEATAGQLAPRGASGADEGKDRMLVTRRTGNIIDLMPRSEEDRKVLVERAAQLRARTQAEGLDEAGAKKGEPYIRFFLGPKKRFGILHLQTEKVVENPHITKVPGVPEHIVGIMNYRGNLLTVLSLRSLLSLGREESDEVKQIIVANVSDMKVGFVVDSIDGEGRIVRDSINVRDVSNMGGETRGIIGIADGTVAILDLEKVMSKPGTVVDMSA